ncbi:acyltransferase domain-containing protein [Kitasatospora purpeofusca]|uniref:[acyl-carrier-protein] S-malonyltransferase n=1 Tax=Kitasatospora purpeofusca TaxID=67352 RepID=A0ABZ1U0P4_9ACTN|nr:acyltransferase domain-containing protein [Kitasatospora purpeofusca]
MPETSIAVLFPGQGAFYGRALADLRDEFPEVGPVLAEIGDAARPLLGDRAVDQLFATRTPDTEQLLREAPEALQLAIYAVSTATYAVLRARGLRPNVLIGHSLGEIAALVAAGAFTPAEGAEIVCHRSIALREAGLGDAYMAAIGTDAGRAQRLVDLVGDPLTGIAVENHAGQTVLSGRAETLDTIGRLAAVLKIDFARLKSPYAFHSPLLGPAAEKFAARIADIRQRPLETTVHSPIIGRAYEDADRLTELLAGHFTARVRFGDTVRELAGTGVSVFVESGALDALSRITGRIVESPVTTVPTLLPEAGGAAVLRQALDRLASVGAVAAGSGGGSSADQLRAALLSDVPAEDFEEFWNGRGVEVRAFAREAYLTYLGAKEEPSVGAANGSANGSVNGSLNGSANASVAAVPAVAVDRDTLVRQLADIYAEALEYPAEVFEEATDLEGELGVDSVKQTELLVRVGNRYELPPRPSDVRPAAYNTLGKIADLIIASGGSA